MPVIRIKSLPFEKTVNMATVLETVTKTFSADTGINVEHISATWEFLSLGHYVVAGRAAQYQPLDTHPILVDILAPDFNAADVVEKMLTSVAQNISKQTEIPITNIFINFQPAQSGKVFDQGVIVRW